MDAGRKHRHPSQTTGAQQGHMLHRLTLRVLPNLTLAVTEATVRKRKRLVMLAPGLVAFMIFRAIKRVDPLSDPMLVLGISGLISAATALWAYRIGREVGVVALWRQDGPKRIAWLIGWVGLAYGVQLSLLVLALLRVLVQYDFLRHPDGPAMMALIIACTSVARDAFEIGHVRKLQHSGLPVLTFPDGAPLRALIGEQPLKILQWVLFAGAFGMLSAAVVGYPWKAGRSELGQFIVVSVVAGSLALVGYLMGERRPDGLTVRLIRGEWLKLFAFWWWPGLAFGATYYLVLSGIVVFVFKQEATHIGVQSLMAGMVAGLMGLYGYYLGHRRHLEDRLHQTVPPSLLRCPFVTGILSKTKVYGGPPAAEADILMSESGQRGS
jgi:hypothetical protein